MTFRRRTGRMFLSTGGKEPKAAGALSMCPRPLTTDCLGGCGPLAVEGIPPGTGDPMQRRDPAERYRWAASRARRRRFCAARRVPRRPQEGFADRRLSNAEGPPAGPSGAVTVGRA